MLRPKLRGHRAGHRGADALIRSPPELVGMLPYHFATRGQPSARASPTGSICPVPSTASMTPSRVPDRTEVNHLRHVGADHPKHQGALDGLAAARACVTACRSSGLTDALMHDLDAADYRGHQMYISA